MALVVVHPRRDTNARRIGVTSTSSTNNNTRMPLEQCTTSLQCIIDGDFGRETTKPRWYIQSSSSSSVCREQLSHALRVLWWKSHGLTFRFVLVTSPTIGAIPRTKWQWWGGDCRRRNIIIIIIATTTGKRYCYRHQWTDTSTFPPKDSNTTSVYIGGWLQYQTQWYGLSIIDHWSFGSSWSRLSDSTTSCYNNTEE